MLNKSHLLGMFAAAKEANSPFVFINIEAEGIKETILIPKESFVAKEAFYTQAYTYELVHSMNSRVKITSFTYGDIEDLYALI